MINDAILQTYSVCSLGLWVGTALCRVQNEFCSLRPGTSVVGVKI